MPVQDNEDSRKKAPEPVPDDEQRKQQAQDNIQKSRKLLPFLNAKAEQHTNRIDNLNSKITTQESKITMRHVFRNAFVPMIQYIPTSLMYTVCGSIYIESLYSIPGMGGLLVDVISRQDNPMVQAIVMIYSCIGIVGLILGDLLMVLVDPRISLQGKGYAR